MAPRKETLSDAQLRDIRKEHGIRMRGPVPPKHWPREHKHHFQAVRTIGDLHYETYRDDAAISSKQRKIYRQRAKRLWIKAYDLLEDVAANESTWRVLEAEIFEVFDRDLICRYCKNETFKPYMVAEPLHEQAQANLVAQRSVREMCACDVERVTVSSGVRDEYGTIFNSANDGVVTHAADDFLNKYSLSMKPDKVIGLRSWSSIPHSEVLFPVTGKTSLLLPFLVVEAKKEGGPGFRATQEQTAFPIRRFLRAQKELIGHDPSLEPCLVWFFAYQGDVWRLHGCILDDTKVKIYDLWQGTIQSHDGALQLLLLVDYIWSWARDIYRPMIRLFFTDYIEAPRDFSPASTDRFRTSISLSCATSSTPNSQGQDLVRIDQEMTDQDGSDSSSVSSGNHWCSSDRPHDLQEADLDPLLRWAIGHENSPSWANFGSVRHADIVDFEFRYSNMTLLFENQRMGPERTSNVQVPSGSVYHMSPREIENLARIWAPKAVPHPPASNIAQLNAPAVYVTFFFHTFCDDDTWQIRRVLNCFVWGIELVELSNWKAATLSTPSIQEDSRAQREIESSAADSEDLERAILDVRQITGRQSVLCALGGMSMVLQDQDNGRLKWSSLKKWERSDEAYTCDLSLKRTDGTNSYVNVTVRRNIHFSGLYRVEGNDWSRTLSTLPDLEQDTRDGASMLAIRPRNWPASTPQFCLFVLPKEVEDAESALYRLLEDAIQRRNYYGDPGYRFTKAASRTLLKWQKVLLAASR